MDRELRKLKNQYEENTPVTFTEKDKQDVLNKIRYVKEKNNPTIYHLLPKSLTVLVAAALIFIGVAIFNWQFNLVEFGGGNTGKQVDQAKENTEKEGNGGEQYFNPFGNTVEQKDLSAHNFNEYIHRMSHQKVKAEAKWGFFRITDERIDWLLEGLDNTFARLEHEDLYREILERWDKGDFSQADKDHNEILKVQGGHGESEATGLLSPEEEAEYIKNTEEHVKQPETNDVSTLLEPYDEIKKIIDEYEFPAENVAFDIGSTIGYTNGYNFSRRSKTVVSRTYTEEGKPQEPTEDQYLPVILGYIIDINSSLGLFGTAKSTIHGEIDNKLDKLKDIKEYAVSYPVIENWAAETIEYLQDAKLNVDTNMEDAVEPYKKGIENISDFAEVIDSQ